MWDFIDDLLEVSGGWLGVVMGFVLPITVIVAVLGMQYAW